MPIVRYDPGYKTPGTVERIGAGLSDILQAQYAERIKKGAEQRDQERRMEYLRASTDEQARLEDIRAQAEMERAPQMTRLEAARLKELMPLAVEQAGLQEKARQDAISARMDAVSKSQRTNIEGIWNQVKQNPLYARPDGSLTEAGQRAQIALQMRAAGVRVPVNFLDIQNEVDQEGDIESEIKKRTWRDPDTNELMTLDRYGVPTVVSGSGKSSGSGDETSEKDYNAMWVAARESLATEDENTGKVKYPSDAEVDKYMERRKAGYQRFRGKETSAPAPDPEPTGEPGPWASTLPQGREAGGDNANRPPGKYDDAPVLSEWIPVIWERDVMPVAKGNESGLKAIRDVVLDLGWDSVTTDPRSAKAWLRLSQAQKDAVVAARMRWQAVSRPAGMVVE